MLDHHIEHIAVHDQITAAVRGLMDRGLNHFDAAEMRSIIVAQEFVVVARQIDHPRALARFAQELLNDIVVLLRPKPARAQLPAVNDIADEIDRVGVVVAQKTEELCGLAAARAEMDIGDK